MKKIFYIKTLLTNTLFVYTLMSFIVTLSVTVILINELKRVTLEHAVSMHSSYYLNLAENFTEAYPNISMSLERDYEYDELIIDEIRHLKNDLNFFPSLTEINLYSLKNKILWSNNLGIENNLNKNNEYFSNSFHGDYDFHMTETNKQINLHVFIPIKRENITIGAIELTDNDENFIKITNNNQRKVTLYMILGGSVLYSLLFILFFNIYMKQRKNLNHLQESQNLTIITMSLLAELRDNDTGAHIIRTKKYCAALAVQLHKSIKFKQYISEQYILNLEQAAPLHDIGKVGIPDNILLKQGKLTNDEFKVIQEHTTLGATVLQNAVSNISFKSYFDIAIQLVKHHHENWDGSGYPDGLAGENIPLSARIMAVADVYDALTTERVYKKAFTHNKALQIIKEESGKKFDPEIINNLFKITNIFKDISNIQN